MTPNSDYAHGYTQGVDDARARRDYIMPATLRTPWAIGYGDGYDDYQSGQAG